MSLPYLFEDTEQIFEAKKWYSDLNESSITYKNCVVKSITHVKNLRSLVVHEYLQAIVEDTKTHRRTRLLAERQFEQDQVIIGRWGSKKSISGGYSSYGSSSSSSGGAPGDLPLPLYSLEFPNNDFPVLELAKFLSIVSTAGGPYSIPKGRHCYWFALSAYDSVKMAFKCVEKRWAFWKWRGSFVVSVIKSLAKPKAEIFDKERKEHMRYSAGRHANNWSFLEEVFKESIALQADTEDEAKKTIEEDLTSLVMQDMNDNITISAIKEADNSASLTSELDVDGAYEAVTRDDGISTYTETYDRFFNNQQVTETLDPDESEYLLVPEDFQVLEPTTSESEKIDYVLKALIGRVLYEYSQGTA